MITNNISVVEVKNEQTIYMTLTSSHFKNKYFLVFIFYFKLKVSILKVLNEDNFLVFLLNIPHVLPTDLKENTTTQEAPHLQKKEKQPDSHSVGVSVLKN